MASGGPGMSGKNTLVERMPNGNDRLVNIGGRKDFNVQTGDRVIIETPGGGGWGLPGDESEEVDLTRTEPEIAYRFPNSYQMRQEQSN